MWDDALERIKRLETEEDAVCIVGADVDAQALRRILIAWKKVEITRMPGKPPMREDEPAMLAWLWDHIRYDEAGLRRLAGVPDVIRRLEVLKGNRLIYPDGTISLAATKIVRQHMRRQLGM